MPTLREIFLIKKSNLNLFCVCSKIGNREYPNLENAFRLI